MLYARLFWEGGWGQWCEGEGVFLFRFLFLVLFNLDFLVVVYA